MTDTAKDQAPSGKGWLTTRKLIRQLRAIGRRAIPRGQAGQPRRRPIVCVDIVPGRVVRVGDILIGMSVDENFRFQLAIITTVDQPVEIASEPDNTVGLCRFGPGGDFTNDYTPGGEGDAAVAEVANAC